MAAGQQREHERAAARLLPQGHGPQSGHPRRTRSCCRGDQRTATQDPAMGSACGSAPRSSHRRSRLPKPLPQAPDIFPGSSPEDRCRVAVNLLEQVLDAGGRGHRVVDVEPQIPIPPVQRPRPGGLRCSAAARLGIASTQVRSPPATAVGTPRSSDAARRHPPRHASGRGPAQEPRGGPPAPPAPRPVPEDQPCR